MALRSGGMISGIDTNSLIRTLVSIEKQPIVKLKQKKSAYEVQISKLGKIKTSALALVTKLKELDTMREMMKVAATSTDTDTFTATANGDAVMTNYDITVLKLAQAEKDRSVAYTGASGEVKAGTLTVTVKDGDAQNFTISDGDSLATVAGNINATASDFTASIINDGTNYYLYLTASETGHTVGGVASNALVISESYTGGSGTELGLTETSTAANATLTIDGLTVESQKNEVQGFIPDVTITAKKLTTQTEQLAITVDKEATKEKLQEFVDAYNDTMNLIKSEMSSKPSAFHNNSLRGDSTVRALQNAMYSALSPAIPSLVDEPYNSLSSFGIKSSRAGTISIDETALEEALDDKAQEALKVFTVSDGIAARMIEAVDRFSQTGGLLTDRQEGIQATVRNVQRTIDSMELRLEKFENSLVRQFTAMEMAVASLKSQGNYLAANLG